MVEAGKIRGFRHGHPQVVPVALGCVANLLERCAHHVLDDEQPAVRRHDEALGRNGPVSEALDVARVLVQRGNRRHELPNKAQRRIDIEVDAPIGGLGEQIRQPRARGRVGNDSQCRVSIGEPLDRAHADERGMTEGGEAADTLAQGELERRHRGELVAHAQHFQRLRAARFENVVALAETVNKSDGRGSESRSRSSLHVSLCVR